MLPGEVARMKKSVTCVRPPPWHCPKHDLPLQITPLSLICPSGHTFDIVGGIPRFVESSAYANHFGLQWKTFSKTQLDSHTGLSISANRLGECLGEKLWELLPNLQVLEAGCGAGRFTEVMIGRGACVTSIDLSDAVEVAQETVGPAGRFAQADISSLPFAPRQFDLVLCIGVIQHTPNPELTISKLWDQVKPGGSLVIDHYSFQSWRYYTTSLPYVRAVLGRTKPETAMRWNKRIVDAGFPVLRALRNHNLLLRLATRIIPVLTYFKKYPALSEQQHYDLSLLDTHDALTDGFKHSRTTDHIARVLTHLGAKDITAWRGGNGVQARAIRP